MTTKQSESDRLLKLLEQMQSPKGKEIVQRHINNLK